MDWSHICEAVCGFYGEVFAIYLVYTSARLETLRNRSSRNPPVTERAMRYAKGIAVVAVIACFTGVVMSRSYDTGAIVFIALLMPVLRGISIGHLTLEKYRYSSDPVSPSDGGPT